MIVRHEIISKGREFLNTKYAHCGRLKGVGIDCVGLLYQIGRELGISGVENDLAAYSRWPDGVTLPRQLAMNADPIGVDEILFGDMLTFWVKRPGLVCHAGLYTPVGLLHTNASLGKVVEHGMDDRWLNRIAGAYRYRGVESFYSDPVVPAVMPETRTRNCEGCGNG